MDEPNNYAVEQNRAMLQHSLRSLRRRKRNNQLIDLLVDMNAAGALVLREESDGVPERSVRVREAGEQVRVLAAGGGRHEITGPGEDVDLQHRLLADQRRVLAAAADIRVQGRTGPEAVPNFALIEVTGCLVQNASGVWNIVKATEPVRTRTPEESPVAELKALESKPSGEHSFRLLDTTVVRGDPPKNRRVEAKGFLIRKAGDDSINLTSLQAFGGACGQ